MRGGGSGRVLVPGMMLFRLLLRRVDPCEFRLCRSCVHRSNGRRQTGRCPEQAADGCRSQEQQPFAHGRGYFPEARGTASTHRAARISSTTGEFDRCLQWERHLRVAHDRDSLLPWHSGCTGNRGSGSVPGDAHARHSVQREGQGGRNPQRILLAKLLAK